MRSRFSYTLILIVIVFCNGRAQQGYGSAEQEQFVCVNAAYRLAILGYENKDPFTLIAAAETLTRCPVKGKFTCDSIEIYHAEVGPLKTEKEIVLDPENLFKDALYLSGNDSNIIKAVKRSRDRIVKDTTKTRGREFSPLIQEYTLNADGVIKLWATFITGKIAEVFVAGNGNSMLDLYIYNKEGRLITSDEKRMDNCYISFTPEAQGRTGSKSAISEKQ